ncbi:MAG: hypothetical protein V7711_12750 [Pseudomonadales bacterium]
MSENAELFKQLIKEIILEAIGELKAEIKSEPDAQQIQPAGRSVAAPNTVRLDKGLLTEKSIIEMTAKHITLIQVGKSVVVTPLAKDMARLKGVSLQRI